MTNNTPAADQPVWDTVPPAGELPFYFDASLTPDQTVEARRAFCLSLMRNAAGDFNANWRLQVGGMVAFLEDGSLPSAVVGLVPVANTTQPARRVHP